MVKRIYLLTGLAILTLAVILAILIMAAPILLYLILPGPGEGKTNSCMTKYYVMDSPDPHNRTQYVNSGDFTFSFQIVPSDDCMLVTLVDFQTVPFYFDGDYNTTHYLGNGSGMPGNYSGIIRVANMSEGYHDVVLLAFVAPGNTSYDFWNVPMNRMLTHLGRFNVIVNSSVKPVPVFENRSTARNAEYRDGHILQGEFARHPFDTQVQQRQNVKRGEVIDYYQQISSQTLDDRDISSTFAIVQLLDYTQVPIRYNSTETVYYGYLGENETCSVHLSINAPDTPGPHRLAVISVESPFEDAERSNGTYRGWAGPVTKIEYLDLFVEE